MRSAPNVAARSILEDLDPQNLISRCDARYRLRMWMLLLGLAMAGFGKVRVTESRRSLERQQELYGYGRNKQECREAGVPEHYAQPAKGRVTWIRPEQSKHVQGRAIDLDVSAYGVSQLQAVLPVCKILGITWGGTWHVRDYGHFEA